ncbi:D-2-hydroxyacid dehydrogenase [Flavihumibacter sp. UBA7668]|uniref:D-2-hydroxyacid dehydrogenase n=1 Tax=Flavihumibacter sp. UBA7668 TaxID=1946542 RepID=UPI0025BE0F5D|nr:D-2-hydroxyacid dehydrogenase [Flavihumibacter sp. UBA7668]
MKIVVLDGYTLNPGDLSWSSLEILGNLTVYDRTCQDDIIPRAKDADVILTNKTPLPATILEQLPQLKFISVLATGYNIIDIDCTRRLGIIVSNVPGYSTASVVQLAFALLLELTHRVQQHSDAVMNSRWVSSPDFSFWNQPLMELAGKTIGIIGFGDIGKKMADLATVLDMNMLAYSRTQTDQQHRKNFRWATIDDLFSQSDIISLHCPLTQETNEIINAASLKQMKKSAYLINTARGPLINEIDLANALNEDWIAGAGLDVLSIEPPQPDNPLLIAKNCLITPHIAWATVEARQRLLNETVANVHAFLNGQPIHQVNG